MESQSLIVETRSAVGKRVAKGLRREGRLPGVFYGKKIGNVPITVPARTMEDILAREGDGAILKVCLTENGQKEEFTAVIREVQRHPLSRRLLHVDFYQISMDDKLKAFVPLFLEGEPIGIKEDGVLQQGLRELEVEALPAELPESFVVDISNLNLGDHLTVADIPVPEGVEMLSEPETVIATVVAVRVEEEEEEEEETVEVEETDIEGEVAEEKETPEEEQGA